MLLPHIAHQCLVKVIACNLDGCADNRAPQRNDRNVGCTASDIHNHITAGLSDINTGADGRSNRLLDNGHFPGACLVGGILHCLFLNLSGSAGDTYADSGLAQCFLAHCLADEIFKHLLCNGII